MNDIKTLEEVGLGEVSRKTHIEVVFLRRMVNKEFDKLKRISTLGFVKILRREYNLDLDEWVQEFEEYCEENGGKQDNLKNTKNPMFPNEQNKSSNLKKIAVILIILAIVAILFFIFGGQKYLQSIQQEQEEQNQNQTSYMQAEEVQEAKAKLEDLAKNQQDSNTSIKSEDSNQTSENEEPKEIKQEEKKAQDESQEDLFAKDGEKLKLENKNQMLMKPTRKIWLGIVSLETNKKRQFLTAKDLKLNLNEPQLLVTGHGDFGLEYFDGKEEIRESTRKQYFYIHDGNITNISRKEFLELNGGYPW